MRVSVKRHRGCRGIRIELDGVMVNDCVAADDCEGWVQVYRRKPDGCYDVDRKRARVRTSFVRGNVRIKMTEEQRRRFECMA